MKIADLGKWGILFLVIVFLVFSGCVQIPQPGSNAVTPAQTTIQVSPSSENNPLSIPTPSKTYVVAATIVRQTHTTLMVTYVGGMDASSLQYISVQVNGENEGIIGSDSGQGVLPVGASGLFAAHDPGQDHVTVIGHFSDIQGTTQQVIADTVI